MTALVDVELGGSGALLTRVLALGTYSKEADPEAGRRHRSKTDLGLLLHRAKYRRETPRTQEAAREAISGRVIAAMHEHGLLADIDVVVMAPSTTGNDLADFVVADVEIEFEKPIVRARSIVSGGRRAKDGHVNRDFVIEVALIGDRALIFDDVYWSGGTMRAIAHACYRAGAVACSGFVIARRLQ